MTDSTAASVALLNITTDSATSQVISRKNTQPIKANGKIKTSTHIPLAKYQLTHNLLYERHFFGESYISAHLTRLQNGVFVSPNIHPDSNPDQQNEHLSKTYVTFVAIAFTLHPSLSEDHRFNSAVLEIKATNEDGEYLRVLRFAPHLAFGRISSASLKWNFQLGASLGVAQGPTKATVDPKIGYEKDLVVGTFMRIQGSTRSNPPSTPSAPRIPDTALVWSLEENSQQEGGLPREFTFVFLLERPLPRKSKAKLNLRVQDHIDAQPQPIIEETLPCCSQKPASAKYERIAGIDVLIGQSSSSPPTPPKSPPPRKLVKKSVDFPHALAAKLKSKSEDIAECIHAKAKELEAELAILQEKFETQTDPEPLRITGELLNARKMSAVSTMFQEDIFTPIHFYISVKPRITNAPDKSTNLAASDFDESIVEGQVGQRFGAFEEEEDEDGESVLVEGLYNFAAMGGHFEDLVELPGSSVGTIEPSLPAK
ncbi:hypothetical protein PZA11_002160 [Diplocarpon coronariae]|uniref:Uncharacterized protein n=1 Tax=Diplocarpon coronariae TaxID=2795749 RepID=A0A218ZG98_9HELO|nr:hypothetical protein B2J93_825 [Marssonina coronariae]